ncbi:MAG TPA: hypothetical protein PLH04_08625 [Pseudomonadales bacterium]|nr:hypothetical protein [Pseudomonadales bacterium]
MPTIRDFRGVSPKFDGQGNYNLGITDFTIFPEITVENVKKSMGLDITIVTSAQTDDEGRELLRLFDEDGRDLGIEAAVAGILGGRRGRGGLALFLWGADEAVAQIDQVGGWSVAFAGQPLLKIELGADQQVDDQCQIRGRWPLGSEQSCPGDTDGRSQFRPLHQVEAPLQLLKPLLDLWRQRVIARQGQMVIEPLAQLFQLLRALLHELLLCLTQSAVPLRRGGDLTVRVHHCRFEFEHCFGQLQSVEPFRRCREQFDHPLHGSGQIGQGEQPDGRSQPLTLLVQCGQIEILFESGLEVVDFDGQLIEQHLACGSGTADRQQGRSGVVMPIHRSGQLGIGLQCRQQRGWLIEQRRAGRDESGQPRFQFAQQIEQGSARPEPCPLHRCKDPQQGLQQRTGGTLWCNFKQFAHHPLHALQCSGHVRLPVLEQTIAVGGVKFGRQWQKAFGWVVSELFSRECHGRWRSDRPGEWFRKGAAEQPLQLGAQNPGEGEGVRLIAGQLTNQIRQPQQNLQCQFAGRE